ncbi:MAG: aromatic ring-hydroxylating dioxygenase subunit alpha [Caldimonas sp.]
MYVRNAWYVACTAEEIVAGTLLGRTICGERMVLFRAEGGAASALEDFCPHRGAPLSLGALRDDGRIVCGYHGLVMGGDGKCVSMPGQRVKPTIKSYPVLERYGFVWVWPGDKAKADPAKLHPLPWAESPEWAYSGGLFQVKCDYRLMIDNLMDLTHETYVHATSIGQPEIEDAAPATRVEGDSAITTRFMHDIPAPPFWRAALRGNHLADDVPVDRWQICRFTPPSHVMIEVGVAHAGHGGYDAPPANKVSSIVVDFITPETDTSIWYFWGMARNFNVEDKALTETIRNGQAAIFGEDIAILESQQRNLTEQPNRHLMRLNIDMGGFESRRILERLVAEERNDLLGN